MWREISGRGTRAVIVRVRGAGCVRAAARTHPRHSVCTRPCCSAPGRRVRARIACVRGQGRACGPSATLSLLDPPASPSPLLCSPLVPCAISPSPITAAAIALSLSFSAALFPSPSLSLSFAPSATQSAMDSRRVRNWLTVNVEFLGYVGERVRYVCYRSREGFVRFRSKYRFTFYA